MSPLQSKARLFAMVWVLGPLIDNVFEPKFTKLAPASAEPASPAFASAQKQHLTMEILATLLFYAIMVIWTLF